MATTAAPSNAINIHVFRNGDPYYKGRKFVVNQRQTRNFESFLSMVTTGVRPQYGAVRKLYTPTHGHKVHDLSDLENNKHYVAAGMEQFRQVQYFSIGHPDDGHRHPNILQQSVIRPVAHSRIKVSARIRKPTDGPKSIHLYRNGDTLYPSVRLLLTKRMLSSWDTVLQLITDRVNLISGAVRRLWHMDGSRVIELSEIENEGTYVASGNERFKKVAYGMSGPLEPSSPRIRRPAPPAKKKPTLLVSKKTPRISPKAAAAHKSTPRRPLQPKPPDKKKKEKTAEQKEAESVFHSRPAMVKRSREKDGSRGASLDFEDGENSVFKAKETRKETRGAAEVNETQETAVNLPIDQVEAEEVEDELVEESHDQIGNHVTQPAVPGATDEKDLMNGRIVVKQEKGEQLNHINAVKQESPISENYNNNHRDRFTPTNPPVATVSPLGFLIKQEPKQKILEETEAGKEGDSSLPLLGEKTSMEEATVAPVKMEEEENEGAGENHSSAEEDQGESRVTQALNADDGEDHEAGSQEDVPALPRDSDPVLEDDHVITSPPVEDAQETNFAKADSDDVPVRDNVGPSFEDATTDPRPVEKVDTGPRVPESPTGESN